jgi:D-amino peptidase
MRVLIACDMEGISGVVHWDQVSPKHAEYARFRQIMTDEVNAAIDGALDGGATDIIVTDGHNNGRNIVIEQLHAPARLVSGSPAPLSMVQGAADVDVAFFIGYHARAGTLNAVLCHTWTDEVRGVWLNERAVGEIGLNAAVCGHFNVPIGLVTGDAAAVHEAIDLLGPLETVAVKQALSRMSALCHPVAENHRAIRAAAQQALAARPMPLKMETPIRLKVELNRPDQADRAARLPGLVRLDGTRVEWLGRDMLEVYSAFRGIAGLGD